MEVTGDTLHRKDFTVWLKYGLKKRLTEMAKIMERSLCSPRTRGRLAHRQTVSQSVGKERSQLTVQCA